MVKGLPAAIIKKYGVTKKAWAVFRGRHKSHRSRVSTHKGGRKTHMTRRRYFNRRRHGGGKSLAQGLMKTARGIAVLADGIMIAVGGGSLQEKAKWVLRDYTAIDIDTNSVQPHYLAKGWGPYLVTAAVTYGIPKLIGMIRRL